MAEIEFTKYKKHGPYHWRQYVSGSKYKVHADYIKKWVREKKVLDVGAGDGLITYLVGAKGIDNEPVACDLARTLGVEVMYGNAYDLTKHYGKFDAVLMADVLEHYDNPERALAEAAKVAPVLYITTPERGMVNDPFHVQEWTRDELPVFMQQNNWKLDGLIKVSKHTKSMYGRFIYTLSNT